MEATGIIRALLALVFVLGLVGLMGWGLRRWGAGRLAGKLQDGRRLQLIEQLYLDPKRKLMLVQCDDREYLVMAGVQGEQLMEVSRQKSEVRSQQSETGKKKEKGR